MADNDLMTDNSTDESALCQSCGLCCQGQLYNWVPLLPEEVERVKTWPVEMMTHKGVDGFKQPCGCLQEMSCSVYTQRPQTCAKYSCKLLKSLRQNEISQVVAMERVAQARELFGKLQVLLPSESKKHIWQRITDHWNLKDLQSLLASGELTSDTLMAIVSLDVILKQYFRKDTEKRSADNQLEN